MVIYSPGLLSSVYVYVEALRRRLLTAREKVGVCAVAGSEEVAVQSAIVRNNVPVNLKCSNAACPAPAETVVLRTAATWGRVEHVRYCAAAER